MGSTGLLTGMAGKILSSYMQKRDPRRGCGSASPFMQSLGYSSAKGYQYTYPKTSGLERKAEKFNFWKFLGNAAMGAVTGGVTSAAFYGAGKGIRKLVAGLRIGKSDYSTVYIPRDIDGNPIPLNKQTVNGQDIPLPSPDAEGRPYTVLGGKVSSKTGEIYRQSATFPGGTWSAVNGHDVPWSEVHWTDYGTPHHHTNPHQHILNIIRIKVDGLEKVPQYLHIKERGRRWIIF